MYRLLKTLPLIIAFLALNFSVKSQIARQNPNVTISNFEYMNSDALDFSPTYYREGLVFVTSRNKERKVDPNINEPYFDLFFTDLTPKGTPGPPQQFSVKINSKYHEGPVTFNKKGDKIYFTRNNLTDKDKPIYDAEGIVKMKIYEADKGDAEWENIRELPFNSDEYSCLHPSIDVDNKRMYFASDMPGGKGGMDIYYSDFKDGAWSTPVNAGPKVNTPYDEVFPYIHSSKVVYFSSNKPGGEGGFDLYRLMPNPEFPYAISLGTPFNSASDDLGLIVSDKGTSGFFTSARGGGKGKDDVYAFNAPDGLEGIPQPTEFLSTLFFVYDSETKAPIRDAGIIIFSTDEKEDLAAFYDIDVTQFDNDELGLTITLTNKGMNALPNLYTDKNGNAQAKIAANRRYFILTKKEGYEPREVVHQTYAKGDENGIGIALQPIKEKELTVKTVPLEEGATIVSDKIFYDFDKSYIRVGAARDLDAMIILMNKYPEVEIDLTAHTDSRGTTFYNQKLSEKRAISAKNYLVANGIQANRIQTFGKGETLPRNNCSDGVKCTEEQHQYNRRTEIYIRKMDARDKIELIDSAPEVIDQMKR